MTVADKARNIGRKVILPAIYGAGIPGLIARLYNDSLTVACYHGVSESGSLPYSGRHITSQTFRRHLEFFRKHFDVVSLQRMFELVLRDEPVQRPTMCITFDDGYHNNLEVALPILEAFEMPATIFISTIVFQDQEHMIYADALDILRIHGPSEGIVVDGVRYSPVEGHHLESDSGRSLYSHIVTRSPTERDRIINEVVDVYGVRSIATTNDIHYWKLLRPAGVMKLEKHPLIDLEAHGHRHFLLDKIPEDDAVRDLSTCRMLFRDHLGRDATVLAFPAGSYSERTKALARQLGFEKLIAEQYRYSSDECDQQLLRRITISGTTTYYSNMLHYSLSLKRTNRIKNRIKGT